MFNLFILIDFLKKFCLFPIPQPTHELNSLTLPRSPMTIIIWTLIKNTWDWDPLSRGLHSKKSMFPGNLA